VLNTPFGQVRSDRPLVFTDDFPAGGVAEFDLRARTYVRFSLDAAQSAYRAEARIGFRKRQGERTCIDFRPRAGFVGPNPLIEADTTFEVRGHDGTPAAQTQVIEQGNLAGLNCGHRLEISLPCKANAVELTLAHFSSPGRLLALNSAGSVVATASLPTQQGVRTSSTYRGRTSSASWSKRRRMKRCCTKSVSGAARPTAVQTKR
jgi:hypothetical protein